MENLVFSNMLHRPARTAVSVLGIAVGVLLIVFTIGLANGTIRKQAQREANVGAEIMFRASGSLGMSGSESFRLPISAVRDLIKMEGVKAAVPIGQNTVAASDSKLGTRLVDGVNFEEYAPLAGLQIIEGRGLNRHFDVAGFGFAVEHGLAGGFHERAGMHREIVVHYFKTRNRVIRVERVGHRCG